MDADNILGCAIFAGLATGATVCGALYVWLEDAFLENAGIYAVRGSAVVVAVLAIWLLYQIGVMAKGPLWTVSEAVPTHQRQKLSVYFACEKCGHILYREAMRWAVCPSCNARIQAPGKSTADPPDASLAESVVKRCENCGRNVAATMSEGDSCPHCHVTWTHEKSL